MKLDEPQVVRRRYADLTPLPLNAQVMRKETYDQLVANLRRDGVLTSIPLVYGGAGEYPEGRELILSGNHRVAAAVDAGIEDGPCLLVSQRLPNARQIALEISHNALHGDPDLAILKQRYEAIDELDWRGYSGLDDKTLELLHQVDVASLSEANLEFQTVQIVFLPAEADAARTALEGMVGAADERWLAAYRDYAGILDVMSSVHSAWNVGNLAVAFGILVGLAERHLTDLQAGYLDPDSPEPRHKGHVGIEVVLGTRTVPAATAAALTRCLKTAIDSGIVETSKPWQLLDIMIADFLDVP